MANFKEIYPKSLTEWHQWLAHNYTHKESIWLVLPKKDSGKAGLEIENAILEALCWGWIDSTPNKIDDNFYKVRFSKRNEKSNWSAVNKKRIAKLKKEKRLQKPGMEMIKLAKQLGTWTALDEIEKGILPNDLLEALAQHKNAKVHFEAFPFSIKRGILEWIMNAKRSETRAKRIVETAVKASRNERANQFLR